MAMSFRPRRRGMRRLSIVLASLGVVALAWIGGFFAFVAAIPEQVDDPDGATDAIVVLTGGSGRLEEGLTLLAQRRAKKLFVSGVYQGVDVQHLLELSQRNPSELLCCIVLGYAANSTWGNATETAAWIQAEHFTSLRLVTANYHMPRSLIEFHHAMPDVRIVPHAVFPPQFKREDWWRWPGTAQLILVEYLKFLVAGARHGAEFLLEN